MAHARVEDRIEEIDRGDEVVPVVAARIRDRLAHLDARREMKDRIDTAQGVAHGVAIPHVGSNEDGLRRHGVAMPRREIVDDDDVMPRVDEHVDHVRADVPGATRDQDVHRSFAQTVHRSPCHFTW